MKLRDYQADCCVATLKELLYEDRSSLLLVLPTGTGKTVIFSEIAHEWRNRMGSRVLVVCPTIELVYQSASKLEQVTCDSVGIEQAHNWSPESLPDLRCDIVCASRMTLTSKNKHTDTHRYERFDDIGLVIVDEAHLSITSKFIDVLDHFQSNGAKVLGVTATPIRSDKKSLQIAYQHNCYKMGIVDAVNNGWLVGCVTHNIQLQSLDLSSVTMSGGDFSQSSLGQVMEDDKVCFEVADITKKEMVENGETLPTVVFATTVDQARKISSILCHNGVKSEWVCGDKSQCPDAERRRILSGFASKDVDCVVNVGVLTTGWDCPILKHIVLARPTKSLSLFTQIFGRGTRPLPGVVDFHDSDPESRKARIQASDKPHFKFTDLRDNSLRHKLITPVDVFAGELDLDDEIAEIAKNTLNESKDARNISEVIEDSIAERKRREEAERKRLAKIKADAQYTKKQVSVFGGAAVDLPTEPKRRGARMVFGKHKGQLVEDIPTGYLEWLRREANIRQPWLKIAIDKEIGKRRNPLGAGRGGR